MAVLTQRLVEKLHIVGWNRRCQRRDAWRAQWPAGLFLGAVLACAACVSGENALPSDVRDPTVVQTASGAVGYYQQVPVTTLPQAFDPFIAVSALLTDEVMTSAQPVGSNFGLVAFDSRTDVSGVVVVNEFPYNRLHKLRAQTRDARGYLRTYVPDSSSALLGHMYALEGYAEVFLADLYCSGIPLSTVDYGADFTMAPGSSTADVYRHALIFFDSAFALTGDSLRLQHLAAVGRGRTLLALGQYVDAAAAVTSVPDTFRYRVPQSPLASLRLVRAFSTPNTNTVGSTTMGDNQGMNGFNYRSSNDPRTRGGLLGLDDHDNGVYAPAKYQPLTSAFTFVMASGIEARLIEAEAALRVRDIVTWLDKLNGLRRTAWTTIVPATSGPLPDLSDPGTDGAGTDTPRQNLLFRERAFWLYLTGIRQGDLRRLIRDYGRSPNSVYPAGSFPGGTGLYGDKVVIPVPAQEQQFNPKYTGCFNLEA